MNKMRASLNLCTLLEKYCYSKKITAKELEFLERCWIESLNRSQYNRYPGIAPAIVCDEARLPRGSYWITCNAAILDKLRPIKSAKSRSSRILDILTKSGIIAA